MIKQYLLKSKQELVEKRIDFRKLLKKSELKIKENIEFIHLIEESQDKNYNSFFPQNYRTVTNKEKIKKLKEEQRKFEEESKRIEKDIDEVDRKIEELNYLISLCKQKDRNESELEEEVIEKEINRMDFYKEIEDQNKDTMKQIIEKTEVLYAIHNKMELCYRLMDMDPKRCKIELKNISKDLQEAANQFVGLKYIIYPFFGENINIDSVMYQYIDYTRKDYHIKISFKKKGKMQKLSEMMSLGILRIIQTVCQYMLQIETSKITIEMESSSENIILKIVSSFTENDIDFIESKEVKVVNEIISLFFGSLNISETEHNVIFMIEIPVSQ